MEMKMITLVNQKRKGLIIAMTLALFLSVVSSPSYAVNSISSEVTASEQQNRVTGTVTNIAGTPIPGAYVFQKGTENGAITGADGKFTINVPANSVLEVSFIGYVTTDVNVGTRTDVSVALAEDVTAVGTVVITGWGVAQQQSTLTGATSSVGADLIGRSTVSLSSTALMGKVAGLNFRQSSGQPGSASGSVVRVRGMGGDPLFIIDGVESDKEKFVNLNYYDIENVTVLKDASAALYGSKAGNGVLIITTKRGRLGEQPTVTLFAQYGWSDMKPFFPTPTNAEGYIFAKANSQRLAGRAIENLSFSKEQYDLWRTGGAGLATADERSRYQEVNWKNYLMRTAGQVSVRAAVSGGSETTNYYFSFGQIYEQLHIFDPTQGEFNRTNGVINIDTKINKRLTVGVSATGSFKTDRKAMGANSTDPAYQGRLAVFKNLPMDNKYRIFANGNENYPAQINNWHTNPHVWTYEDIGYIDDSRREFQVGAYLDYKIMDGLNLRVDGGYSYNQRIYNRQNWPWYYYTYNQVTDEFVGAATGSYYRQFESRFEELYTSKAQLSYGNTFGKHTVAAVVGSETYSKQSPVWSMSTNAINKYSHIMNTSEINSLSSGNYNRNRRVGFIGNVRYDYDRKYLLELIGRYDGSYTFQQADRWGFFPAVSAGWRLSEERWWKEGSINNVMSDFKIRASWGKSGLLDGISAFDYLAGYNMNQDGIIMNGSYLRGMSDRGVPKFYSWLWVEDIDLGVDFAFLNGKLRGSLDYFVKTTDGIIASRGDVLTPSETGWSTPSENLNSDKRRGMDGSLTWNSSAGEFQYSIGANFTFSRRYTWTRYGAGAYSGWNWYKTGATKRFANQEWGFQVDGQFQSWEEIANHAIEIDDNGNNTLRPGDFYFKDLNKDGRIGGTGTGTDNNGNNNYDIRVVQFGRTNGDNPTPNLNYGINMAFAWRGLDLSLQWTGGSQASFWIYNELQFPFQNDGNILQIYAKNQWRYDDPWAENPTLLPGKYPSLIDGASNWNIPRYYVSDFWKVNCNYLKLKNIELGYTLPKAWLDKVNIKQVRLAATVQNAFVISSIYRDFGVDPEMYTDNGMDYSLPRTISLGLTLKF